MDTTKNTEKPLSTADYMEIIKSLPPKALEDLLRRYNENRITNERTLFALSMMGFLRC